MVDGQYIPFSRQLYESLINDRRLYTDYSEELMIILSAHLLPSEFHAFVIANDRDGYQTAGKSVRGFAAREQATLATCHAPSQRKAMLGLAESGYGWNQPHSIIMYSRDSWQERTNSK